MAMNTYKQYCHISEVPEEFVRESEYSLVDVDIRVKAIPALFNLFSNESYNIVRFDTRNFREALTRKLQEGDYDVVILESLFVTPYVQLIRDNSRARIVLRSHNVEYNIWLNLARNEGFGLRKWYLNLLSRRLKKYELGAISKVDLIASISNEDNDEYKRVGCKTPMMHLPFGIDMSEHGYQSYQSPEFDELVLFHLGSMDWKPHQEAMRWFLNKVWPEVLMTNPHARLYLAGAKMPEWILHGKFRNVEVIGCHVDSEEFMGNKALMIVPSFSGSGIRVKIAEGMARGKVIITTANGIQGIPARGGEHVFVSDDHHEWVRIISECMSNLDKVRRISESARNFALAEFDYIRSANKLLDNLNSLE
jgi:glycosyltransferase involved in cell wall biosynthesis